MTFRSHLDGAMVELSPERAIEIQILLGIGYRHATRRMPAAAGAAGRGRSCHAAFAGLGRAQQARFRERAAGTRPVRHRAGRRRSATARRERTRPDRYRTSTATPSAAWPWVSRRTCMLRLVENVTSALPAGRPRYLMGVGTPADLVEAVARGVDMFDCVLPTRNGRHGLAFTRFGPINLKNARHADDPRPLDEASACSAARDYSRAYLHHLVKANEMLGAILLDDRQPRLLPGADGGHARGHRGRQVCGVPRGDRRRLGAGRCVTAIRDRDAARPQARTEAPDKGSTPRLRRRRIKPVQTRTAREAPAFRETPDHGHQPQSQRGEPLGSGRAGYAAALRAAQRSRAQRREVRLRTVAMRRLHRADRRQGGALLRHPGRRGRRAARSRPSKASARSTSRMRCSRPSSTSRRRNAATAATA